MINILAGLGKAASAAAGFLAPAVAPVISGLFGSRDTDKTNEANLDAVKLQNASNEKVAQQNLQFQRENLDYQKALQQKIFDREDSSYSRTVADMRAAGLNPLTMNGTNQAGAVVPTQALNNQYQAAAFTGNMPHDYSWIANIGQNYLNAAEQIERISSQKIENRYNSSIADDRVISFKADALSKVYNSLNAKEERLFNQRYGINKGMTPEERKAAITLTLMGVKLNNTYDSAGNDTAGKPYNALEYSSPRNISAKEVKEAFKGFANDIFISGKSAVNDIASPSAPLNPLNMGAKFNDSVENFNRIRNSGKSKTDFDKKLEAWLKSIGDWADSKIKK